MKKIISILFVFACFQSFGQTTVDSVLYLRNNQLKDSVVGNKPVKILLEPLAASLAQAVSFALATATSANNAVATLTADVKALNDRIARLEALAPGLPAPVEVTGNSYTITPNDNGKTIYVYSNATITLTVQAAGFKCKVIRMGTGRTRFVTSGITLRLRANFTPLSVQYQAVELEWKEGEVVIQ